MISATIVPRVPLMADGRDWEGEVGERLERLASIQDVDPQTFDGCSPDWIEQVAAVQGLVGLPAPNRWFLSRVGRRGPALSALFPGEAVSADGLVARGGPSWLAEVIGGSGGLDLFGVRPVFLNHQDFQVLYLDGVADDAAVRGVTEGGPVELHADGFIGWLDDQIPLAEANAANGPAQGAEDAWPTPSSEVVAAWSARSPRFAGLLAAADVSLGREWSEGRQRAAVAAARAAVAERLGRLGDAGRQVDQFRDVLEEAVADVVFNYGQDPAPGDVVGRLRTHGMRGGRRYRGFFRFDISDDLIGICGYSAITRWPLLVSGIAGLRSQQVEGLYEELAGHLTHPDQPTVSCDIFWDLPGRGSALVIASPRRYQKQPRRSSGTRSTSSHRPCAGIARWRISPIR